MNVIAVTYGIGTAPVVTVDGQQIEGVFAAHVRGAAGEIPHVDIELRGGIEVTAPDGASVEIGGPSFDDWQPALVQFLAGLDPDELDKAVMAHPGSARAGGLMAATLDVLRAWAAGEDPPT